MIDYKGGTFSMPRQWFEEQTDNFYPKYANPENPPGTRSVEYYILGDIGERMRKWLELEKVEDLHAKPIWSQIVAVVKTRIEELDGRTGRRKDKDQDAK
jgi:hypothetical protein